MQTAYQARRDLLVEALRAANLRPYVPRGTYFVLCDIVHLGFPDDVAFCRYLTTEVGVAAIPPSFFTRRGTATWARDWRGSVFARARRRCAKRPGDCRAGKDEYSSGTGNVDNQYVLWYDPA